MFKETEEAKKFLLIKKNNLDNEIEIQPELYQKVAEICMLKISVRDELKEEKDKVWAEEFLKAKTSFGADGKSPSDKVAEAKADSSVAYLEVTKNFLEAKKEADIWFVLKEAFQQKSEMLKELSRIFVSGFYSNVEVKATNEVLNEEKLKKIRKEMRRQ